MAQVGINFRQTGPYVTDNAGDTYCLGEAYPTIRNSQKFGFSASLTVNARNRVTAYGPNLAGIVFASNGTLPGAVRPFYWDLPDGPGTYKVRIAIGDATNDQANQRLQIIDGSTVLATIQGNVLTGQFIDATGVHRVGAAWNTDNQPLELTFTEPIATFALGTSGSGVSVVTRISLEFVGAANLPISFSGTIPNQSAVIGTPFSLNLAPYFNGSFTPFTLELAQGSLAGSGLSISGLTISGTPSAIGNLEDLIFLGVDAADNEAFTNEFSINVADISPPDFSGPVTLVSYRAAEFKLSYSAASSSATGYEVSIDGGTTYSSVGNSTTPTVAQVLPSVLSKVKVRAYDADGRKSVAISPPLGVLGTVVPSTGEDGPAGLYDWLVDNPSYMSHLVHMHVVNWPAGNTLEVFPNSSGRQTPLAEGQAIATVKPVLDGVETSEQARLIFNSGDNPPPVPAVFGIMSAASYYSQRRRVLA